MIVLTLKYGHILIVRQKSLTPNCLTFCSLLTNVLDESSNMFRDDMDGLGFVEYAQCATHSKGGHIDHMYIR